MKEKDESRAGAGEVKGSESTSVVLSSKIHMMNKHNPISDDAVPMAMVDDSGDATVIVRGKKRKNTGISVSTTGSEPVEIEPLKIRSVFPETWLWDIVSIGLVYNFYHTLGILADNKLVFFHIFPQKVQSVISMQIIF